jgi:hypothetical protein
VRREQFTEGESGMNTLKQMAYGLASGLILALCLFGRLIF